MSLQSTHGIVRSRFSRSNSFASDLPSHSRYSSCPLGVWGSWFGSIDQTTDRGEVRNHTEDFVNGRINNAFQNVFG